MATLPALVRRLRRLIDDTGHGYSQSAPGFATDISASGLLAPAFAVQIDGDVSPTTIMLPGLAGLSTGNAIALAIQNAIHAADPALPSDTTQGYSNASVVFDPREGYVCRSGTMGSLSRIHFWPPSAGDSILPLVKLGAAEGGYETPAKLEWADEELEEFLQVGLETQNETSSAVWQFDTLPDSYTTIVVYRGWSNVIDAMLGRTAWSYPQKVDAEEVSPNAIFDNLLKLSKRVRDQIDELQDELEGAIVESTMTRWDMFSRTQIGDNAYKSPQNNPAILSVIATSPTTAILEFGEILTPDVKTIYVGYRQGSSEVIDRSVFSDPSYTGESKGFEAPSVLYRTLNSAKNTVVKITGLSADTLYYFQIQVVDQNGNRHFSNTPFITTPAA